MAVQRKKGVQAGPQSAPSEEGPAKWTEKEQPVGLRENQDSEWGGQVRKVLSDDALHQLLLSRRVKINTK